MEGEVKNQKGKTGRKGAKKGKSHVVECPSQLKKQNSQEDHQGSVVDDPSSSSGWSSEVIEPAIKSMCFRKKRGTRMKELIKGKRGKDHFWDKYQDYFGGDLDRPEDEEDLEDYQASSSGRDEFDSDFDLTDSYIGKRGRKKGTKVRRKRKPIAKPEEKESDVPPKPKGKRGRKKKVPLDLPLQQPGLLNEAEPNNIENIFQAPKLDALQSSPVLLPFEPSGDPVKYQMINLARTGVTDEPINQMMNLEVGDFVQEEGKEEVKMDEIRTPAEMRET